MIEPDDTIRFKPADVPELPELQQRRQPKRQRKEIPEPTDFRPHGAEW